MTVLDLCCCMGFSLIAESRAILYCGMQASHGGGFSHCRAWALAARASVTVAHGLNHCSSQALEHRLNRCSTDD